MIDSKKIYELAQLAEASYADFQIADPARGLQLIKFSDTQASEFVKHWRVVAHQHNTESGFSATLFQRIDTDPVTGFQAGQYVYAVRGTEPGLQDLSTDLGDIVADGLALDQIVDLYNHWNRLQVSQGQFYAAAKLETLEAETAGRAAAYLLGTVAGKAYDNAMAALGYLIDQPTGVVRQVVRGTSDQIFGSDHAQARGVLPQGISTTALTVTGHSLGGILPPHLHDSFHKQEHRLSPSTERVTQLALFLEQVEQQASISTIFFMDLCRVQHHLVP